MNNVSWAPPPYIWVLGLGIELIWCAINKKKNLKNIFVEKWKAFSF